MSQQHTRARQPGRILPRFPFTSPVPANNVDAIRNAINKDILPTLAVLRSNISTTPTLVDADYLIAPADTIVLVTAATPLDQTLPLVRFAMRPVWIKNCETSAAVVTVRTNGEALGTGTTLALAVGASGLFVPDGTQWWKLP